MQFLEWCNVYYLETLMFLDVAIKLKVHFVCRNNFQKHASNSQVVFLVCWCNDPILSGFKIWIRDKKYPMGNFKFLKAPFLIWVTYFLSTVFKKCHIRCFFRNPKSVFLKFFRIIGIVKYFFLRSIPQDHCVWNIKH